MGQKGWHRERFPLMWWSEAINRVIEHLPLAVTLYCDLQFSDRTPINEQPVGYNSQHRCCEPSDCSLVLNIVLGCVCTMLVNQHLKYCTE